MQINLTLERETKNTVRFAEDEAGQPSDHPGYPVVGTLYVQKAAHIQLGASQRIAVTIEARDSWPAQESLHCQQSGTIWPEVWGWIA